MPYYPHREERRYWFPILHQASRREERLDLDWEDEEAYYERPKHRRAVSFDEGRSSARYIAPRRPTPLREELSSALKKPSSPTDSTNAEPSPSRALTIHVDAPKEVAKKEKDEGRAEAISSSSSVASRLLSGNHIQKETFIRLERMGVKGPASLQYIDYSYLVNPEGAFHKGQQVEGLMPPELSEVKVAMRDGRREYLLEGESLVAGCEELSEEILD